jgi:hypothetical protein
MCGSDGSLITIGHPLNSRNWLSPNLQGPVPCGSPMSPASVPVGARDLQSSGASVRAHSGLTTAGPDYATLRLDDRTPAHHARPPPAVIATKSAGSYVPASQPSPWATSLATPLSANKAGQTRPASSGSCLPGIASPRHSHASKRVPAYAHIASGSQPLTHASQVAADGGNGRNAENQATAPSQSCQRNRADRA